MPIIWRNRHTIPLQCSFFTLYLAMFLLACPHASLGVSFDDQLHDPQRASSIGIAPSTVGPRNVINSNLSLAEHSLKQGAWQDAAQYAQFVLAKEKDNSKAHAILGLLAALGGQQEQAEKELTFIKNRNESGIYPELIAAIAAGQKNNIKEAQDHLALALQKEPHHPVALYYGGSLELAQGKLAQAEKAFLAVLRLSPEFAPALAGLGQVYWRSKQTDKAVSSFRKAIAVEPDTLLYRQQLIALYKSTGQQEAENKAAKEMLYFIPGVKERSIEQGLTLLNHGDYDEAIKQADTLLAVYKKFPFGHYLKAAALVNKGEGQAARKSVADLLAAGARTVKTHHEAGLCFLALGDLDKAEEQFKLVIALEPDNSRSFVFIPIIEQLRGHRDRAINGLSVMLSQKEPPSLIHFLQANNYLADSKMHEYRQAMEQGQALIPGMKLNDFAVAPFAGSSAVIAEHRNLMVLFYYNGWHEQTARKSALILKEFPSEPFALWYNGLALMAQQRYQEAAASLKKMAQLYPTLVAVHMELGQAYALMRDEANALASFQKAAETSPSHAPAYIAMGDLHYQAGQDAEAVRSYRKAIEITPEAPLAYSTLAILLAEKSETLDEALKLAEKGVVLAPNDPVPLDALGWVHVQQGQPKAGIEQLRKALDLRPRAPHIMYHLGMGYFKDNQPEQAKHWLQTALAITKDFRGNDRARETLNKIDSTD